VSTFVGTPPFLSLRFLNGGCGMKKILCYGDSNTWGYNPEKFNTKTGQFFRYEFNERWPGILSEMLGDDYTIIEEAYNGRTTVFEDPNRPGRMGLGHLNVSFWSHEPLDAIVIMLGINDTKDVFSAQPAVIGWGMERLVRELKYVIPASLSKDVKILLIAPTLLEKMENGEYFPGYSEASRKKTEQLPALYENIAKRYGCYFLNAAEFTTANPVDGIHMPASQHKKLAAEVYKKIKEMIG